MDDGRYTLGDARLETASKICGSGGEAIQRQLSTQPRCRFRPPPAGKTLTTKLRRAPSHFPSRLSLSSLTLLCVFFLFCLPAEAAYIRFKNCLSSRIQESQDPRLLQFEPLHLWASFDNIDSINFLNVTTYGNVTGVATDEPYPSWDDPSWRNPNETLGKIVDLSTSNNKYSTLFSTFKVLSYTQYDAPPERLCESTTAGQSCPLIPAFNTSKEIISLPGFGVSHKLDSSYAFTSITATLRVTSGDASNADLACVSATITPYLGGMLRRVLRYLPMLILFVAAAATVFAATFSPWGSLNTFHWTSNWGRDEDLLRLVTPGFADCLQYIQFIFLSGSLSLNYPGFFRPVVSSVGWSALMFNKSFVSQAGGTKSRQDGLYVVDSESTVGLDQMSQIIGMGSIRDIWAGMMVWLLVIIAIVVALIQLGFALSWIYRTVAKVRQQDLQNKNWPFTLGMVIRIVVGYFLLPVISLSMYQLVEAPKGPTIGVILAAFVVVAVVGFACWLTYLMITVRPRAFLFDDLPTVLTYGPLYNTYSDGAASFASIHIFITLLRGIAIGAVQPSGIAQLVLLAICEIILGLTLNAIRPYPAPTAMNLYHTSLAILRAIIIFLSVTFAPSLGVRESPRGWVGYIILLLHAAALVFGFFLNALQTTVEVAARLAGAGGQDGGATRGGLAKVFGLRQLQNRGPRQYTTSRHSMASDAAMLSPDLEQKSTHPGKGRSRSLSASSAILLQRSGGSEGGRSSFHESGSSSMNAQHRGGHGRLFSPNAPEPWSTLPESGGGHRESGLHHSLVGLKQSEASDPYYRTPRQRRNTMDLMSPSGRSQGSRESREAARDFEQDAGHGLGEDFDGERPSISGPATPVQAQTHADKDYSDDVTHEVPGMRTGDYYASREVDHYYGVRGPALSSGTRKLKTGPADPTGPVSSVGGWFKNVFGAKTKDKGKGFEVVRSARASTQGFARRPDPDRDAPEQYRDHPTDPRAERRTGDIPHQQQQQYSPGEVSGNVQPYPDQGSEEDGALPRELPQAPRLPPSLPLIDAGGGIELPSRTNSRGRDIMGSEGHGSGQPPFIPRKSSKRKSSQSPAEFPAAHLSTVTGSSPSSPKHTRSTGHQRLKSSTSGRFLSGPPSSASKSDQFSAGVESTISSVSGTSGPENQEPASSHIRNASSVLGSHTAKMMEGRPSSIGYVQQHRASDSIRQVDSGSPKFIGSTAEIVEDASQPSRPY